MNYDKFFTEGDDAISRTEDYHSHNTSRLDVEGMKELLLKLNFIREDLGLQTRAKARDIRSEWVVKRQRDKETKRQRDKGTKRLKDEETKRYWNNKMMRWKEVLKTYSFGRSREFSSFYLQDDEIMVSKIKYNELLFQ